MCVQQSAVSFYTNGDTIHADEMLAAVTSYNNNSKHCLLFPHGIKNCLYFNQQQIDFSVSSMFLSSLH